MIFWAVDVVAELELDPNGRIELNADVMPIKNVNKKPQIKSIAAYMLAIYTKKFGITYDLSLQAKYPTNIDAKNTENIIVNNK